jgi:hypothetical protein
MIHVVLSLQIFNDFFRDTDEQTEQMSLACIPVHMHLSVNLEANKNSKTKSGSILLVVRSWDSGFHSKFFHRYRMCLGLCVAL